MTRTLVYISSVAAAMLLGLAMAAEAAAPGNFSEAKSLLRNHVYHDRATSEQGDLYCGCSWSWSGKTGGRMHLASCGYETADQPKRAQRLEYEHIVPAWNIGHQRQCWQKGGRKNCVASDPIFQAMEADLHNLSPTIGEVNADRSNFRFGMVTSKTGRYGACQSRVDKQQRIFEPRDEVKGFVARVTFYMADRYNLRLSRQQQQLLMAWERQYPVSEWELTRDERIAQIMGHHNPFVRGEKRWALGFRPSGEGLRATGTFSENASLPAGEPEDKAIGNGNPIIGNRNSRVYHLPQGCPSYRRVAPQNQVEFVSEGDAEQAGYRRAGNCR